MPKIRITKEFTFEMAHALWNYDGPCRNIHGHSYKMYVTVIGEPLNDPENPKHGMVIDFTDLKRIVNQEVVNKLDHAFMISKKAPAQAIKNLEQMFEKQVFTDYQPSVENMLLDFAERIIKQLPENVKLYSLRLHETATAYAEWFAEDQ